MVRGTTTAAALSALPALRAAQLDDTEKTAAELITPAAEHAIARGLAYLAQRQHDEGSFGSGGMKRNSAVSSLCGLSLMSGGSTPGRGAYGEHVQRCVDFILEHAQESGFITVEGSTSQGPMYGHGFATLFLAEAYGMALREDIRAKLAKAVELIVQTQNKEGGWRYQPRRHEADLSVTVCQLMALRAARNAGLFVPHETIDRSIEYVIRSQNADGGFMYMVQGGASAFPRSAAGVVALYSAGIYEGPEIDQGLKYLIRFLPGQDSFPTDRYFFYGHYYAVQAMWHGGGQPWNVWYPAIRDELVERQQADGSWQDAVCDEYGTAMACIILQMPNNYLPIFQR
jgi:hypothetical protein